MYTEKDIVRIVELNRQILPELQRIAKDYDGKLRVLAAIHEDLVAEQKTIAEYKENQILDCEMNLLGEVSSSASKDAETIMKAICEKFKSESNRLAELELIEQELKSNMRPVEHVRDILSFYIDSMSKVLPDVSGNDYNNTNHKMKLNKEKE